MAKRRYRIEGSNYGGEIVVGEVNPHFVRYNKDSDGYEIVEQVLEADDWAGEEDVPNDALLDPDTPPSPALEDCEFVMWECDDIEHMNGSYADGEFTVYEVPANGEDDWSYDKEIYTGDAQQVYGREGAYFSREEPAEDIDEYIPVLAFHSSEKGTFACWFLDTDEEFDRYKLGFGILETNLGEFVDRVYYNKEELETNYDYNDTTGKSYEADVGWLNKKWVDHYQNYNDIDAEIWEDYDANVEWEKENQ